MNSLLLGVLLVAVVAALAVDGCHADLSIGVEAENGDGAVWSLRGVTTKNAVSFGASSAGLSTSGYPYFGADMLR
ncbi:hypothetical protein [Streptomyces sp. 142MFCol3.1]|uniref:hypothetical protein n=1 Tax=Streptomyces sp. 142MFCol3.1 TaxID=1172179 RepID=UPI00048B116A|nr:hypothetical protein [Streptomyces sp. 142MFCol3.1]